MNAMHGGLNREQIGFIGLDIGTSAVKGVLMSAAGTILSRETHKVAYLPAVSDRVQFDADQLYRSTADVIRRLTLALPPGGTVAGLSIASASGNTVLVNGRGEPLLPAISWMDSRVRDEIETVFGKLDAGEVHDRVGWPLLNAFPLAHLSWLKCHAPELLDEADVICMSTDYILFKLTGNWAIDPSTATTMYLQDQQTGKWHLPTLNALGVPERKLPPISPTGTVIGQIGAEAALDTGLVRGTPVVLGTFDHPCSARGAGVVDEGQLLLSCGTSWVGFCPVNDRRRSVELRLLTDPYLHPAGAWGGMFSLSAIATSIDRYIRRYLSDAPDRYNEFNRLAASAQQGAGGLVLDPSRQDGFDYLEGHAKADIARALMEGTAYLLKRELDRLEAAGMRFTSAALVGGPSETHPWPQIVADVLGMEVRTANGSCAGAAGAAIVAAIGVGQYADERDALRQLAFPEMVRVPDRSARAVYRERYGKFQESYT
ncbi:xylulokinase [Paenibacillus chitinolyticus]|uniref:xylulokinase n=1 Tax=Paenibacillus chitinolyticus TaxID=79263 RepID=UPI00295E7612|nr:FGGY family carbohydrate kinase [Paenibacillus chitinolyticus]